jgi:phospholipase C
MRLRISLQVRLAALSVCAIACGCSSSSSTSSPPPVPRVDDATAKGERDACHFARGAMPVDTLGKSTPIDKDIPIENVVVVMMENHSFDNYFSHLNAYAQRTDIESAPDTATNPDASGQAQARAHAAHPCTLDTDHEWAGTHQEINGGAMDGFFTANDGYNKSALPSTSTDPSLWSGARSLSYYDERDIPFYYALASTFAIADHYHASVPGPTWPNRLYLYSGTSFGETYNLVFPDKTAYPYPGNPMSIVDELEASHVGWMMYTDTAGGFSSLNIVYETPGNRWGRGVTGTIADFKAAAAAGSLPPVSFVDPDMLSELKNGDGLDEHPPGDIQSGQKFAADVITALFNSPQWAHSALFLMYDEHGGFYDHVAPPKACAPDGTAPVLQQGDTTQAGFDMYGVRVPMIVVSPYARKSYVGHEVYDHTSVTRFIEAKFKLPALSARDANAQPPMDLFDFTKATFATPPSLPAATIDSNELTYCTTTFGG